MLTEKKLIWQNGVLEVTEDTATYATELH